MLQIPEYGLNVLHFGLVESLKKVLRECRLKCSFFQVGSQGGNSEAYFTGVVKD